MEVGKYAASKGIDYIVAVESTEVILSVVPLKQEQKKKRFLNLKTIWMPQSF